MTKFSCEENPCHVIDRLFAFVYADNHKTIELEVAECPHCHGLFAVDANYLADIDVFVLCPMCCLGIEIWVPSAAQDDDFGG